MYKQSWGMSSQTAPLLTLSTLPAIFILIFFLYINFIIFLLPDSTWGFFYPHSFANFSRVPGPLLVAFVGGSIFCKLDQIWRVQVELYSNKN